MKMEIKIELVHLNEGTI